VPLPDAAIPFTVPDNTPAGPAESLTASSILVPDSDPVIGRSPHTPLIVVPSTLMVTRAYCFSAVGPVDTSAM
jgi:hypothetical protein